MYRKIALYALCLMMLSATAAERYLTRREAIRAANDFRRQKRYVEAEHAFREAQRLSKSANERKSARESANEMHGRARALQNDFKNQIDELKSLWRDDDSSGEAARCYSGIMQSEEFPVAMKFEAYRICNGLLSRDANTARLKGDYKLWQQIQARRAKVAQQAAELPDLQLEKHDEALREAMFASRDAKDFETCIRTAGYLLENASTHKTRMNAAAMLVHGYQGIKDYENVIRSGNVFLRQSTGELREKQEIRVIIGNACLALKRYEDAVRAFRGVATTEEESGSNWHIRAAKSGLIRAYEALNDDVRLKRVCEEILSQGFDEELNRLCNVQLFRIALRTNNKATIAAAYQRCLKESVNADQKAGTIHLYMSWLIKEKRHEEALKAAQEALALPGCSEQQKERNLRRAAECCARLKMNDDFNKCQLTLAKTIRRDTPFEELLARANAASAGKDSGLAIGLAEQAIKASTNSEQLARASLFCGKQYFIRKEHKRALDLFERASNTEGLSIREQIDAFCSAGRCHAALGNGKQAEAIFLKALKYGLRHPDVSVWLAGPFYELTRPMINRKEFKEVITLAERFTGEEFHRNLRIAAYRQLASAQLRSGDPDAAIASAENVLSLEKPTVWDTFDANMTLAQAYQKKKDYDRAEHYARNAANGPENSGSRRWAWWIVVNSCKASGQSSQKLCSVLRTILEDPVISGRDKVDFRLAYIALLDPEKDKNKISQQINLCKKEALSPAQKKKIQALEAK